MKPERQRTILELVQANDIYSQRELKLALEDAGFHTAQATVSRDIRELRLTKVLTSIGHKFAVPGHSEKPYDPLERVFRDGLVSMDYAGNMLVLRTINGMAEAVALALDNMNHKEILGTVAGDDVVMCVVKTESKAAALMEKLRP